MNGWTCMLAMLVACGGAAPEVAPDPAPPPAPVEAPAPAAEPEADAPTGRVFFESPTDGAVVTSPVKLVFGADGVEVEASGIVNAGKGHHHIIVNEGAIAAGEIVPKDGTHIHYGGGQTEAELELAPGAYTLTMQFADGAHASYGPDMATSISITVDEGEGAGESDHAKPPTE